MECHRRNQYLTLGPSSPAKMDGPHRCAPVWKVACKQQIVLSGTTVTQDSSPDLRDRLLQVLSEQRSPRVITVDLSGVTYIEASGIATLLEALKIARHRQMTFCLQGLGGSVLRLFEVTGVLALFEASDCKEKVS